MVTQGENKGQNGVENKEDKETLRTTTVLLVENTKGVSRQNENNIEEEERYLGTGSKYSRG